MVEEESDLKITYIGHSGFLVEMPECCFLFDYYEGELPKMDSEKPLYLLSSHSHPDHFNPAVFDLLKGQKLAGGIFSKDIYESRIKEGIKKWFVEPEKLYELPLEVKVETFRSTDKGVAFLVTVGNNVIYHGGDLNDWIWEGEPEQENHSMSGRYQKEIKKLAGRRIDAAFVPLDSRQERYYDRGMLYFLEHTEAKKVIPMHFWKKPEIIDRFLKEHGGYENRVLPLCKPQESTWI